MSLLTTLLATVVLGQEPVQAPKPAKDLLAQAQKNAVENKTHVMVIFHASWCGWCKRLDAFMGRAQYKPIFAKDYEIVHLDVLENGDKKSLENPGGEEVMVELGGKGAGLPFIAITDAKGKLVINSLKDGKVGGNVGCPWEPEEVKWFLTMIDKTKSHMSVAERRALETGLLAQKTEKGGG